MMQTNPRVSAIDWRVFIAILPYLFSAYAWVCWLGFLLLATVLGLHDAGYFSPLENLLYCLLGLVLCLASSIAVQENQRVLVVALTLSVQLLAAWF